MAQTIRLKRSAVAGRIPSVNDLDLGEVAINTTDGKMYIKKSSGGTESVVEIGSGGVTASFTLYEYTASAAQTTFTGSDDNSNTLAYDTGVPPKIQVFLNGVLLDYVTDYTATNGTSVVLESPASANDLVQVAAYKSVTVDSDIALGDNTKILLGNDGDLELFHNGSNSVINQTGTGNLLLQKDETTVVEVSADGIDVTGEVIADSLQVTGGTGSQGTFSWNTIDGTVDLDLGTSVLQIGQEHHFYAKATEAIANGDVVMFAGAQGDHVLIAKADHGSVGFKPEYIMGVATQAFANNAFGYVTAFGKVRGLNTSTLDEGDILYSDPDNAGALTTTRPSSPDHVIQMAAVLSSNPAQGVILVRPTHFLDTDEVEEGSTNLYFTDARAVSAIQADASWNASDWDTAYTYSQVGHLPLAGGTLTGTVTVPQLNVDTVANIDTLTSTTTSTTGVAIDAFAAATYRSARYTVQATNTTDSTYHITELLVIHDGTTAHATEYGTIFTGAAAEAAYEVDISSGNVRLIATPASSDSITFKVVRHSITV